MLGKRMPFIRTVYFNNRLISYYLFCIGHPCEISSWNENMLSDAFSIFNNKSQPLLKVDAFLIFNAANFGRVLYLIISSVVAILVCHREVQRTTSR